MATGQRQGHAVRPAVRPVELLAFWGWLLSAQRSLQVPTLRVHLGSHLLSSATAGRAAEISWFPTGSHLVLRLYNLAGTLCSVTHLGLFHLSGWLRFAPLASVESLGPLFKFSEGHIYCTFTAC